MHGMTDAPSRPHFISLQLLRAFAAIAIVYYHSRPTAYFGSFGIDIFFVLSGFVIAMVAQRMPRPAEFAVRRIARVVPLYWVCTLGVFAIATLAPSLLNSTTANDTHLLKSLFFIPYFKENGTLQPVLAVGWTLNYEMLFYAVATLALLIRPQRFCLLTTLGITLLYLLGTALPIIHATGAFLNNTLLFEFLFGMGVYHVQGLATRMGLSRNVWALCAMLTLLLMMFSGIGTYGRLAVYGVPSFFLVLCAVMLEPWVANRRDRLTRLGVYLGDASYAIYLTHYYIIEAIRKLVAPHLSFPLFETPLGAGLVLMPALAFGALCYRFIDQPGERYARMLLQRIICRRNHAAAH